MIESDATRLRMIKAVGGVLVRHNEGEFWAIFDNDFLLAGDVESRGPVLTARSSDVDSLAKDTVVDIGSVSYRIKRPEPDGTGMTLLILKR